MPTFVARPTLWRLILLFLLSLGFVVGGFWAAGFFGHAPKPGKEWIGWLSIVFFGLCSVLIFGRLFDKNDQVRISSLGIYSKQWSEDTIPWSEITNVSVWEFKQQKNIILQLREPERYSSTTLLGKLAKVNRLLTGGDVAINLVGTDSNFNDAMAAIAWFQANPSASNIAAAANIRNEFGKKYL